MVWEQAGDCHNPYIADSIRCNTMEDVMAYLLFANNNLADDDSYYKVRPIFKILNIGAE